MYKSDLRDDVGTAERLVLFVKRANAFPLGITKLSSVPVPLHFLLPRRREKSAKIHYCELVSGSVFTVKPKPAHLRPL